MMKKSIYLMAIIAVLITSCSPPMYIPDAIHVTTLNNKGEFEVMAVAGTNGADLGGAYAITDNFGVQVKGSIVYSAPESEDEDFINRYYTDLGFGYSNTFGTDESLKGVFSLFGGAGYGEALGRNTYVVIDLLGNGNTTYYNSAHGNYMKYWFQPMIGMKMAHFELLFTPRISYVNFTYLNNKFQNSPSGLDWQNGYTSNVFYEPVITLRAGGKRIKGMVQFGASIPHIQRTEMAFKQRGGIFNFGLSYNFGPIDL